MLVSCLNDNSPIIGSKAINSPLAKTNSDSNQQEQTEEMLYLYERAMAAASNGIVIADANQPDLPIIYCNPAFEKISGYSQSEVLGKNCRFLQGKDTDPADIEKIRQSLQSGNECFVVIQNYRKDGTPFWNELIISPVRDASGKITHFIGVQNDITKRKKAEESLLKANEELEKKVQERTAALQNANEKLKIEIAKSESAKTAMRESEARFRAIFEMTAMGIAMSDIEGQVIVSNPALQKMLGYTEKELRKMVFTQFTHPEDSASEVELFQQLIAGERDYYQMEKRFYRKDGKLLWGNLIVSLIRDGNGKPQFAIGMVKNITDSKQTENTLRTTTSRLSALIQNLQAGILVENESRQIVLINQDFCQKFGIPAPPEALIGMDCSQSAEVSKHLFAEPEKFVRRIDQILTDQKIVNNEEILLANGRIFERDYVPIFVEDIYYGHLWMYRDITQRKQAEIALNITQERLKFLLSTSPAVIYSCKADGDYGTTFMSDNVKSLLAYEAREFVEDSSFWASHIHPEDAPHIFAQLPKVFEEGFHVREYRLLHKDGTYRWIYDQVKLVRDSDGNPLEIIGYWADISERKLAEAERSRLAAILEASTDFVGLADPKGNILWNNKQFKKLICIEEDTQIKQKRIGDYHPQWALEIVQNQGIPAAIRDGVWIDETALINNDGIEIPVSQMILAHKNERGTVEYFSTLIRDITPLKQAEAALRTSLKEKEVLLKEIHHRVKNNLQVISSLLKLQSAYIEDKDTLALFTDSQNRVKAMALIHEKLYQSSDLARILVSDYIKNLTNNLLQSYSVSSSLIKLNVNVDNVFVDVDTAIPCGLIINELLSNSFKYAFPDGRPGQIWIEFKSTNNSHYYLRIGDNGIGLPPDFNLEESESLGLQLVWNLTEQLGGNIEVNSQNGARFEISFTKTIPQVLR